MSDNQKNIIIVPVYNEEATIKKVLQKVNEYSDADILLVNDGSTDNSIRVLENIKHLKIINHSRNIGYGHSLIKGFHYAIENRYQTAVTIDCDDQHEPQMIPEFFEEINEWDILTGSRYLKNFPNDNPSPPDRKRINNEITAIINKITGFNLTDSFCGFKAYKIESLKKLTLTEYGYAMPLQLWVQAWTNSLNVSEKAVERIYPNIDRSFGQELDNSERRLAYYKDIIKKEMHGAMSLL